MKVKEVIGLIAIVLLLSSCASQKQMLQPTLPVEQTEGETVVDPCPESDKVWGFNEETKTFECVIGTTDAGKRCRQTTDCQGFCEGTNDSLSSGSCSETFKPYGCVFIVERGEKIQRCIE